MALRRSCAVACLFALLPVLGLIARPVRAAVLPTTITTDRTLAAADSPWELQSDVTIAAGAHVTVEPSVRIIARGDYRLTVSGSLTAMSSPGTQIVFRATNNHAVGAWKGLYFTPGSVGRFQRCTFRSAADNVMADSADVRLYNCNVRLAARDGVYAWGDGFLKAAYCRFQNNRRYGVHVQTSQPEGAIIFSEFVGNGAHPVRIKATCLEILRRGNSFAYNAVEAVGVDCGSAIDIEDTDCWRDQDLPLDLAVGSPNDELVIGPAGVLRIASGLRLYPPRRIVVHGRLLVDGLTDARVVIQPQGAPVPGAWLGIEVKPGALARINVATVGCARNGFSVDGAELYLRNVVVRDSEQDAVYAGGAAHVDLAGCAIEGAGNHGLHLPDPDTDGKVGATRIANCAGWPVRVAATVAEALRGGNSYVGNGTQRVGVLCGLSPDIRDDDAWLPQGVPFDLGADPEATHLRVGAGARLSLRPGVRVVGGGLSVAGVLVAEGEPGNLVSFGSEEASPTPGDWSGIEYVLSGAGRLVNTNIAYAQTGVTVTSPGYVRIEDTEIRRCADDGIRLGGAAVPLIARCSIHDNGRWGVGIFGSAQPLLGSATTPATNPGRNSIVDNAEYDLANQSTGAILAQRNWWGTAVTAEVAARIYDRADNPSVGRVTYAPFLSAQPAAVAPVLAAELRPTLAIMSVRATPAGTGASIQVALSGPANLRAIVRNIAGRPVRELTARVEERDAIIPWDGRDLRGSIVPAGRYLVEVEALAEDGGRAHAMAGLTIAR